MNSKTPLKLFVLGCILISASLCSAQEARIVMPPAVLHQAYSQNIAYVLRDKYRVTMKSSSATPSFEWRRVGLTPPGLGIMPTGEVMGTPVISKAAPYLFRVEVIDRSLPQPAPLRFQLSLQVLSGEAPELVPIDSSQKPEVPTKPHTPGTDDVIISPIAGDDGVKDVSTVDANVVVLKSSKIKKLVVEVRNNGQSIDRQDSLEIKDLTATQGIASPKLKVAAGKNTVFVFDADTMTKKASADVLCSGECGKAEPVTIAGAKGSIILSKPKSKVKNGLIESAITVKESSKIKEVAVEVLNKGNALDQPQKSLPVQYENGKAVLNTKIKVASGTNKIRVYDPNQPAEKGVTLTLKCKGDNCATTEDAETDEEDTRSEKIVLDLPDDARFVDATLITPELTVTDGGITKVFVTVSNDGRPVPQYPETVEIPDTKPQKVNIRIAAGKNEITIFEDTNEEDRAETKVVVYCEGAKCGLGSDIETNPTAFTRAIVGIEQAAAASANSDQKLFLEFNLTVPLFKGDRKAINAPFWLWLNPRITSVPQQNANSVAEFSTSENFFAPFVGGKVNDIVQGVGFIGGIEQRIGKVFAPLSSGFGPTIKSRFSLSFIAGVGAIAPMNPEKSLQVFKVNSTVVDRFPDAEGKEFIAFVSPERTRFLRTYFGGFRLKTYFVKDDGSAQLEELAPIFPGIIDITFGQNEAVTRGRFRGGVVRIDGIYPLPFIGPSKKGLIYVFGSVHMKLTSAKIEKPIFLQLADPIPPVPSDNVFIQEVPALDRDYYKFGIGVDLIRLIRRNN